MILNNMKKEELDKEFTGRGEVRGFRFKQIKASDRAYIYEVVADGRVHYEVFQRRYKQTVRLCYKLIYAPVKAYIKDVPEKNLRDIENAQELKDKDALYSYDILQWREAVKNLEDYHKGEFSQKYVMWQGQKLRATPYSLGMVARLKLDTLMRNPKYGLFIAAPQTHFNLEGFEKTSTFSFSLIPEVKDPIVFRYVRGGVQVLTKWGTEAEDPSLVVPKLN